MKNKLVRSAFIFLSFLSNFDANLVSLARNNTPIRNLNSTLSKRKNPTIKLKFTCAGSGCASPRKVVCNPENIVEISSDYLSNPEFKKSKKFDISRFKDLTEFEPVLVTSFPGVIHSWKYKKILDISKLQNLIFNKLNIYKNGLFFEIKRYSLGDTKLKFICPGVGSENIFPPDDLYLMNSKIGYLPSKFKILNDYAVKSDYLRPGTFNVGRYSVENNIEVLYKTILYFIDKYASKGYNIEFELDGHSRGAVTIGRVLDCVVERLNSYEYCRKLKKSKIYFNCVLYDPVAGPDVSDKKLSLSSFNPSVNLKLTQVISMDTGAPGKLMQWAFSSSAHIPTDILDSTIVFLPLGHDVGNKNMSLSVDGKIRKTMWKYDNKLLKFGQIGNLPPGVYFPNTKFYVGDPSKNENTTSDGVCLTKDWRIITQPNGDKRTPIAPIELLKLEHCDKKTLSLMQEKLLMDNEWVQNCNRKDTFLKLANASLHINNVLPEDKELKFDSKFNLRVSEIKKLDTNSEEEYNKDRLNEEAPL